TSFVQILENDPLHPGTFLINTDSDHLIDVSGIAPNPVGLVVGDIDGNCATDIAIAGSNFDSHVFHPAVGVLWGQANAPFIQSTFRLDSEQGNGYDLVGWSLTGNCAMLSPGSPAFLAMSNETNARLHVFRYLATRS